jgi:hypothetical protein
MALPLRKSPDMDPAQLKYLPLFAALDDAERAEVAECARERTVDAGTALTTEGEHAYELFVIESGEAEVHKGGEVIRTLGPETPSARSGCWRPAPAPPPSRPRRR